MLQLSAISPLVEIGHIQRVDPENPIHSHLAHFSTQILIFKPFVWHILKYDICCWCQQCHHCQLSKIQQHIDAPLICRSPPIRCFDSTHLHIVGPLPSSEGMSYFFTIIDKFSHCPDAISMADSIAMPTKILRQIIKQWLCHSWSSLYPG